MVVSTIIYHNVMSIIGRLSVNRECPFSVLSLPFSCVYLVEGVVTEEDKNQYGIVAQEQLTKYFIAVFT